MIGILADRNGSTVDRHSGSGDKRGFVATKEKSRVGNLFGLCHSTERNRLGELLEHFGFVPNDTPSLMLHATAD